jgi:uncharacterized protein (TIGR02270 family)
MILAEVIRQHADDAMFLASNRAALVDSAYARLPQVRWFDQRLAANLDGLRLAGAHMWEFTNAALETPSPGAVFTVTVRAIDGNDDARLARMLALVRTLRHTQSGLLSAFCWVDRSRLRGTVAAFLKDADPFKRAVGMCACAMHGTDPGIATSNLMHDTDPGARARTLSAAGELGLRQLVSSVAAAVEDDDPECQFWAAWSGVLLGDRNRGLEMLVARALAPGEHRTRAFALAFQAMPVTTAHTVLKELARDPQQQRWLIRGSGLVGDPAYLPWLLKFMTEPKSARLAGEAFTLITGVDLTSGGLDRPAPTGIDLGPNDDPADPNVDMDPDDGLPWPDLNGIERWCGVNAGKLTTGVRHFMGMPVSRDSCVAVLKSGTQRQRALAASHLCLLEPGTPLFNTSAPAWRQQRLLAEMT